VSVIDQDGHPLADAVVVVEPVNPGTPKHPLPMQATIAQEKMPFIPIVTGVPAGLRFDWRDIAGGTTVPA
jgi:hypothetical protein